MLKPINVENAHIVAWQSCLGHIRALLPEADFNTWFKHIEAVSYRDNVLVLRVPSYFFHEYLETHFLHQISEAIRTELGARVHLSYEIGNADPGPLKVAPMPRPVATPQGKAATAQTTTTPSWAEDLLRDCHLESQYTFDSFIEGDCNHMARAAAMAVAERPGTTSFNPLVLYGGVGLGKTHLVNALGNKVLERYPHKRVLFTSSTKFTSAFVEATRFNRVAEFHRLFMGLDVLILDDIQFLAGKPGTQDLFFQIFNDLMRSEKQIILTSDVPPADMKDIEERLVSRFKWGVTLNLFAPSFETRLAIIKKKMELEDEVVIDEAVLEYLAKTVKTNVRELEGTLITLIAQVRFGRGRFDVEAAKRIIGSLLKEIEEEVDIAMIQRSVSEFYSIPSAELTGTRRTAEIAMARQVAMFFAKQYTGYSLKSIGDAFGGKDHTTVMHAIKKVHDRLDTDKRFRSDYEQLKKRFDRD